MRKSSISIAIALGSIAAYQPAEALPIKELETQRYPDHNRHTGKAAERRNAKRRRRAKK